ncbi:MAG: hypothetical protein LBL93_06130 [Ruminococcus sp.]|jgi:hypothetical protein|nr:hypothetical protein [Ruminococcus sp.]
MQLKGVTKKIIEIPNTENPYFEKAILYVKPYMSSTPPKILSEEAKLYMNKIAPKTKHKVFGLGIAFMFIGIALVSGVVSFILFSKFS